MTHEDEVRAASDRFYVALRELCAGKPAAMYDAWHKTSSVTTAHPMGFWSHSWEQVRATWDEIAATVRNGKIEVRDLRVFVYGDVAYTTGIEDVEVLIGERIVTWSANVTNIFHRQDGEWKVVHHHSDKAPAAEKAIDDLAATP